MLWVLLLMGKQWVSRARDVGLRGWGAAPTGTKQSEGISLSVTGPSTEETEFLSLFWKGTLRQGRDGSRKPGPVATV